MTLLKLTKELDTYSFSEVADHASLDIAVPCILRSSMTDNNSTNPLTIPLGPY